MERGKECDWDRDHAFIRLSFRSRVPPFPRSPYRRLQMIQYPLCEAGREAGHRGELGHGSRSDPRETAKALQEATSLGGPYAGNAEQLGCDGALGPPLPVVGQPKSMRLIPGPLKQPERRAAAREA